ncbi:MAG: hypothetical protein AAFV53_00660 [Myxococcota bacterium]
MSLKDSHLEDAQVLGQGGFKLDRRRAMEKLARFQLEDPHRYVLELVAAAVCAGTAEIIVRNDSDDLELTWDGDHPTEKELDDLFDHIFYRGDDRRQRMLQHLAQGLYGALGLSPRWIHLVRPGLWMDFTDPLEVSRKPDDRTEGVFIHVRERFSWKVVVEAIRPFDVAYETKLLQQRAQLAPVPIIVNGSLINDEDPGPPPDRPWLAVEGGKLWLSHGDPRAQEGVFLIQDGVIVQPFSLDNDLPVKLCGWVDQPSLRLNASRSAVIEDHDWRALMKRLEKHQATLLAAHLKRDPVNIAARRSALRLLEQKPEFSKQFDSFPLFTDAAGSPWTLRELNTLKVWIVADPELVAFAEGHPIWVSPTAEQVKTDPGGIIEYTTIRAVLKQKVFDANAMLTDRRSGMLRRRTLSAQEHRLEFDDPLIARSFSANGYEGTVAILPWRPDVKPGVTVTMFVEGLPVTDMTVPLIGRLYARVTHPGLEADPTFTMVLDTPARRGLSDLIKRQALALLETAGASMPTHPLVRPMLRDWLNAEAQKDGPDLDAWLKRLPKPFVEAPLFRDLDDALYPLSGMPGRKVHFVRLEKESEWAGFGVELPEAVTKGRLVLNREERRILQRALGRFLIDKTDETIGTAARLHRQTQSKKSPKLTVNVLHRASVSLVGLTGVIGLQFEGRKPTVQILHQGLDMGEITLPIRLPGAVASVEWADATPNTRWDKLDNPDGQAHTLARTLRPSFVKLVEENLAQWRDGKALPAWVAAALTAPLGPSLLKIKWFPTIGGDFRSIAQLKKQPSVQYITDKRPAAPPPGQEDVLLLDVGRLGILQKHIKRRQLKDVTSTIRSILVDRQRFLEQPRASRSLDRRECYRIHDLQGEGLRGQIGVRRQIVRSSMIRVRVLYQDRVLDTLTAPHFLIIDAIVYGDGIKGSPRLKGLSSNTPKRTIMKMVQEKVQVLVEEVVSRSDVPRAIQLVILDQLLRRQRMAGLEDTAAREAAMKRLRSIPLFRSFDGEPLSLNAVEAAHEERRLQVLTQKTDVRRAPPERVWLPTDEAARRVLRAAIGQRLPLGDKELEMWAESQRRQSTLPVAPEVPTGFYPASLVIRNPEGTIWVGLERRDSGNLLIEWRIQDRIIQEEKRAFPIGVQVRVSDPRLKPNAAFTAPASGAELDAVNEALNQAIETFLLQMAESIRVNREGNKPDLPIIVRDVQRARAALLVWGAKKAPSEAWEALHLLRTADGGSVSLAQLKALAERGPIRVVRPGVQGRTLDPDRPAIVAARMMEKALRSYGGVTDFTTTLAKEEAIVVRRNRPPASRPTPSPHALVTRDAPGDREGFVQVLRDGTRRVVFHVEWRTLNADAIPACLPLVGFINDDALKPDQEHVRVLKNNAYKRLMRALAKLSWEMLDELLDHPSRVTEQRFWLRALRLAFEEKRDLLKAKKTAKRLANLPLFQSGAGAALSALDVARHQPAPRWVPLHTQAEALPGKTPFVQIAQDDFAIVQPLFGGEFSASVAEKEAEILARRQAPPRPFVFEDPDQIVAEVAGKHQGIRFRVGLSSRFDKGSMTIRASGVFVSTRPLEPPGMVALVEVPEDRVDANWSTARIPRAVRREMNAAFHDLVHNNAQVAVTNPRMAQRIARHLEEFRTEPWISAPMIRGVDGWYALKTLQEVEHIEWADVDSTPGQREGLTVLRRNVPSNMLLLTAASLEGKLRSLRLVMEERDIEERLNALRAAEREKQAQVARLEQVVRGRIGTLLAGIPNASPWREAAQSISVQDAPIFTDAAADPDGPAGWLLAAWALGGVVPAAVSVELMIRLGERLQG